MKKRGFCLWLLGCLLGTLAGCGGENRHTVTYTDVFDTVTVITVYGRSDEAFAAEAERFHEKLAEYHRLFDIYTDYAGTNNLKTLNEAAGGQPVELSGEVLSLLEYGLEAYAETEGRVNILFGAVLSLWHDCREQAKENPAAAALPTEAALRRASAHTDPACLELNREEGTARIADPEARVDVGAIAKGYAVERMAAFARQELGWESALLNVGGNVRAIGGKGASATPFVIGLENPDGDGEAYLARVEVADGAVVTSGDYQRYYTVAGKRYAHIIDVDTLYPATEMRAVSVLCEDSGRADMWSTALFTLSLEKGQALVAKTDGLEAAWVLADGRVVYSAGFFAFLKK